jgi:predicted hotdog family 3-hydroxylacyl-ACP dehydratase
MIDISAIPIQDLLPHRGALCLLTRALWVDEEHLIAQVDITTHDLFARDGVVGAWVGIEYMAQAIAAWAGWQARQRGDVPSIGLLVGTRHYRCHCADFAPARYHIKVTREFQADNGLGQFTCEMTLLDTLLAQASITVFSPTDLSTFLNAAHSHDGVGSSIGASNTAKIGTPH